MKFKNFLYYSKSDRIAIAVLAFIAIAVALIFHFIGGPLKTSNKIDSDTLQFQNGISEGNASSQKYYKVEEKQKETFLFDPNTADSTQLLRLGLQPWQVRNIYKYRASGGVFQHTEDFAKVYGLTKGDYDRLAPYIRIADRFRPASEFVGRAKHQSSIVKNEFSASERQASINSDSSTSEYVPNPKLKQGETIEVNVSDTVDLQKIPGIGPYYAKKILYYKNQLGGFANKQQLLEIEGFPEEALDYITVSGEITRLNLNKLNLSQLRKHPYLNFYQAKEIIDFHRKNGPLKSLDDLRFSKYFTQQDLDRLVPYVEF